MSQTATLECSADGKERARWPERRSSRDDGPDDEHNANVQTGKGARRVHHGRIAGCKALRGPGEAKFRTDAVAATRAGGAAGRGSAANVRWKKCARVPAGDVVHLKGRPARVRHGCTPRAKLNRKYVACTVVTTAAIHCSHFARAKPAMTSRITTGAIDRSA